MTQCILFRMIGALSFSRSPEKLIGSDDSILDFRTVLLLAKVAGYLACFG